jgi:hypothetical protein
MSILCISDFFFGYCESKRKQCPYCALQISFSGTARLNGKQCPYCVLQISFSGSARLNEKKVHIV